MSFTCHFTKGIIVFMDLSIIVFNCNMLLYILYCDALYIDYSNKIMFDNIWIIFKIYDTLRHSAWKAKQLQYI